ncbi:MAG: hypothetical protein K2K60_06140 [Clostridia bacterium]|nr:hypothetical protein [Clostridia bacterium]
MAQSKVKTYIGFCIKSRKIALGAGAIDTLKGGVYLLIADGAAAKNSQRLALKYKNRFSCPLLICKENFEEVVNKPLCRLAAVKDKNLADAILKSGDSSFELYTEGGE